jgi:DNA-binding transcriptional regulator YiaG
MHDTHQSESLVVIHDDMKQMYQLGIITDAQMREFDDLCLNEDSALTAKTDSSYAASPIPAYTSSQQ